MGLLLQLMMVVQPINNVNRLQSLNAANTMICLLLYDNVFCTSGHAEIIRLVTFYLIILA